MDFKSNLKTLRKTKNFTQEQLAKEINISPETIKGYEQGKREPKFLILEQLTRILNCSYDDLLK